MKLTNDEIIHKLRTDVNFGVQFIVDNGYNEISKKLESKGVSISTNTELYTYLRGLLDTNKTEFIDLLSDIVYNPNANNYTANLQNDIIDQQNEYQELIPMPELVGSASGKFLDVLGSVLTGIGSVVTMLSGTTTNSNGTPLTQAQLQAIQLQEIEAERIRKEEAERKAKNTKIALIVVGVIAVSLVAYFLLRKKK